MPYDLRPVTITPGIASTQDFTPQSTAQWTFADKVRMVDGFPEKIGGWTALPISSNFSILGVVRMIFSYSLANVSYYLLGSNSHLYSITGNSLYNATPLDVGTDMLNNVMGTYYGPMAANPFDAVFGLTSVTVTDPAHPLLNGQSVKFVGSGDVQGIPAAQINTTLTITYIDGDHYSIVVTTPATGTGAGGGAGIVRATRIVSVMQSNTYDNGDNVGISALSATVGGIPQASINGNRVAQGVTASGYNIVADAFATSSASAAGGNVTITHQIAAGPANSSVGSGYGLGLYGVGLYGVASSASIPTLPRIWSSDRFGNLIICTPGTQTGLYSWASTTSTLPLLVTNAPTAINYCFSSDNIAVTLGASDTPNRIKWSDQGNLTVWSPTAQNQAGEDDIEGAAKFISHAALQGYNLLFTSTQVYSFRYIGAPFVWQTQLVEAGKGLIAQNGRIVVNGIAYWMGLHNWYWYNGGNIDILPSNTTTESTIRKYVFNNLNWANASKIFCWYNPDFNEIWWHYPSGTSTECNAIARFNILDRTWVMDTMDRTAAEYPSIQQLFPYLTDIDNNIMQHENGYDDDTANLPFACYGPYFSTGSSRIVNLGGVYPDNIVSSGTITMGLNTKRYPSQIGASVGALLADINSPGGFSSGFDSGFQVGNGTLNLTYRKNCRYWQYAVTGDQPSQFWRAGQWMELWMLTQGWR